MITDADVAEQLEELRSTVAALKAALDTQPRLTVRAVQSGSYLGQAVGLVATVTLRDGLTPVAGVPVTLVTAFGVLRGDDDLVEGTSLACQTGADGTVRVTLRPLVSLENSEDQDALEAALAELDPAAPSPTAALKELEDFARRYRWGANRGLRAAVDAYFSRFGEDAMRDEAVTNDLVAWPLIPATVVAYAGDDVSQQTVAATVTVTLRNWLGPWLQVYRQVTAPSLQPGRDLAWVKQNAASAAGLIAGVFDRVDRLVDDEPGRIGKWFAGQAAQRAIETFLDTGIADLPEATRATITPILNTGARTLRGVGATVLGALGQTHAANAVLTGVVATKVDSADFTAALLGKASVGDLQAVQSVVATKVDTPTFTSALATKVDTPAFTAALGTKVDASTLTTFQQQTATALGTKLNASTFATFQQQNTAALGTKVDTSTFTTFQQQNTAALGTKVDTGTFTTFQQQTTAVLATKVDTGTFTTFQQQTATALGTKLNVSTFNTFQQQNTAVLATKVDTGTFTTFQQQTVTALGTKLNASTFSAFQTQNAAVLAKKVDDTELARVTTRLTTLERR